MPTTDAELERPSSRSVPHGPTASVGLALPQSRLDTGFGHPTTLHAIGPPRSDFQSSGRTTGQSLKPASLRALATSQLGIVCLPTAILRCRDFGRLASLRRDAKACAEGWCSTGASNAADHPLINRASTDMPDRTRPRRSILQLLVGVFATAAVDTVPLTHAFAKGGRWWRQR